MSKSGKTTALDLLGDILEDTQKEAEAEEQKRKEAERLAKEEEKRRREEEAERIRAEAEERLRREEERRREAEERIRMTERQLQEFEEDDEEDEAAAAEAAAAAERAAAAKRAEEEKKSPVGAVLGLVAVALIAAGGYFGYQEMNREYVSPAEFSRAQIAVTDLASLDSSQELAFVAKPAPPEEEVEEEAAPARRTYRQPSGNTGGGSRPALRLGGSSVFGGR